MIHTTYDSDNVAVFYALTKNLSRVELTFLNASFARTKSRAEAYISL